MQQICADIGLQQKLEYDISSNQSGLLQNKKYRYYRNWLWLQKTYVK